MSFINIPGECLPLDQFASNITLTAAEKKIVANAQKRQAEIYQLGDDYVGGARRRMKDARWNLSHNPSPEAVEKLVQCILIERVGDEVGKEIKTALGPAASAAIDEAIPVALRTIDDLVEAVKSAHAAHCESLKVSPMTSPTDYASAERRLNSTLQYLADRAGWVKNEHGALSWLAELGVIDED